MRCRYRYVTADGERSEWADVEPIPAPGGTLVYLKGVRSATDQVEVEVLNQTVQSCSLQRLPSGFRSHSRTSEVDQWLSRLPRTSSTSATTGGSGLCGSTVRMPTWTLWWPSNTTFIRPFPTLSGRSRIGTNFRLDSSGWGVFQLNARVRRTDGSVVHLTHMLELFYPEAADDTRREESAPERFASAEADDGFRRPLVPVQCRRVRTAEESD